MKLAETVTFGAMEIERLAALRDNAEAVAALRQAPAARVLPFWRGKPLIVGGSCAGWLPVDHPMLADAGTEVLLGRTARGPCFARDVSGWEPTGADAAAQGGAFDPAGQGHPLLPPDHLFEELRRLMTRLSPEDAEAAALGRALLEWHRGHGFCASCGARSEVAMAGWQRHCAACGARHFPRTDPVVIMLVTHGNSVLIGRSPGWPERMYSLLAGFIDPAETIEAAVRREVFEEAGVRVGAVGYLASQPWPFPASLMIGCRAEALTRDLTPDPAEIEDARWLTREEMADVFAGQHPAIDPPRAGAIAHFLLRNWLADRLD